MVQRRAIRWTLNNAVKTWLEILRPKKGRCTTFYAIQDNTRSSCRFITPIFPEAYIIDMSQPPPRIAPNSYLGNVFINTRSSPWLLRNGTDYLLTLFYCQHWLSSVRQFGLLTASYQKHNSPAFNLILTLILLIVLTLSSTLLDGCATSWSMAVRFGTSEV